MLSRYAPDTNTSAKETGHFYKRAEARVEIIPYHEKLLILEEMNLRMGNKVINGMELQFNEKQFNHNGEQMIVLCIKNNLRL